MTAGERRRAALRHRLDEIDADAILVTRLVNVRYLSGFTGSNAALLVGRDGSAILATDGRYAVQAQAQADDVELLITRSVQVDLARQAVTDGRRRVALERDDVTLALHDRLVEAAPDAEFVDGQSAVETLRIIKDDDEIALLAEACAITDVAFDAVLSTLREGVTERDVDWALLHAMHARGARASFDAIVAFGDNSARPHHQPTDRPLARGDFVTLDFGAEVGGYHADMTRTVVFGAAADWQRDLYALVHGIQADARERTLPGARPADLDEHARSAIMAAGHDVAHGLGHGVGLEIHESPFLTPASTADRLVDRVPVTVEPGVYLPGRGGVRIEDTVVVRAGGAESLTRSPRDLLEL